MNQTEYIVTDADIRNKTAGTVIGLIGTALPIVYMLTIGLSDWYHGTRYSFPGLSLRRFFGLSGNTVEATPTVLSIVFDPVNFWVILSIACEVFMSYAVIWAHQQPYGESTKGQCAGIILGIMFNCVLMTPMMTMCGEVVWELAITGELKCYYRAFLSPKYVHYVQPKYGRWPELGWRGSIIYSVPNGADVHLAGYERHVCPPLYHLNFWIQDHEKVYSAFDAFIKQLPSPV